LSSTVTVDGRKFGISVGDVGINTGLRVMVIMSILDNPWRVIDPVPMASLADDITLNMTRGNHQAVKND
jgi:hypothetical protein